MTTARSIIYSITFLLGLFMGLSVSHAEPKRAYLNIDGPQALRLDGWYDLKKVSVTSVNGQSPDRHGRIRMNPPEWTSRPKVHIQEDQIVEITVELRYEKDRDKRRWAGYKNASDYEFEVQFRDEIVFHAIGGYFQPATREKYIVQSLKLPKEADDAQTYLQEARVYSKDLPITHEFASLNFDLDTPVFTNFTLCNHVEPKGTVSLPQLLTVNVILYGTIQDTPERGFSTQPRIGPFVSGGKCWF